MVHGACMYGVPTFSPRALRWTHLGNGLGSAEMVEWLLSLPFFSYSAGYFLCVVRLQADTGGWLSCI